MKNKRRAFTLVELLAVIVILAVILVIAIPQILKTIKASKLSAMESSAKLIATEADKDFLSQLTLNQYYSAESIACTDVAKLSDDYESCDIVYDENGVSTVTLVGAMGKKFAGITCIGTKDNMVCAEGEIENIENLPTIMAWTSTSDTDFHKSNIRTTITEIEFVDLNSITAPTVNNTTSWDVSEAKDNSVIAWLDGTKLYIGGKGGVKANTDSSNIFRSFTNLTNINFNNKYKTNNATNMSYMFTNSTKLESLDLRSFNTSKVTDMSGMFAGFTGDINNWGSQTKMSLSNINLSSFDTSNVTNMKCMFLNCGNLVTLNVNNFNTNSVNNMYSMFDMPDDLSSKLETIIFGNNWNTTNVINMKSMFNDAESLKFLDLSNFDTSNVTNMEYMFDDDISLKTIYTSNKFVTDKVTSSIYMFSNCKNLIGGNGTKYSSSYIDKTYARIDKNNQKGYYTDKRQDLLENNVELEYIKFAGTQYIDTLIVPSNHMTEIKFDFETFGQDEHLFGTLLGNNYYYFTSYNNYYYWGLDGSMSGGPINWVEGLHTILYNVDDQNKVIFDGNIVGSNKSIISTESILIGRRGNSTTLKGKVYYVKITEKGTGQLVRDFIPVHNTITNTYGLYDKVEGKFYGNSGTGNFIPGPEV